MAGPGSLFIGATDVETLTLAGPDDPIGIAAWSALAAQGFHVAGTVDRGSTIVLLLERLPSPTSGQFYIPAAVASHPEAAKALEGRLLEIRDQRLQTLRGMWAPKPGLGEGTGNGWSATVVTPPPPRSSP